MTDEARFWEGWFMRAGRKVERTLYLHTPHDPDLEEGLLIGIVDTKELADEIVKRWNAAEERAER